MQTRNLAEKEPLLLSCSAQASCSVASAVLRKSLEATECVMLMLMLQDTAVKANYPHSLEAHTEIMFSKAFANNT